MNREDELMRQNKSDLVVSVMVAEKCVKELKEEVERLLKENERLKIDDYIYRDYLEKKEMLEEERRNNVRNCQVINDLNDLLDRYKNIVDNLGGS